MTAGLRVIGDSGSVQVDDRYANLALRHSGTATTASSGSLAAKITRASITVAAIMPIIAYRSTSYYLAIDKQVNNGDGSWTFDVLSSGPDGSTFDYWIFDKPQSPSSSFGVEVFDESGNRTFWSGFNYARVRAAETLSFSTYSPTYDSGRIYAVTFARLMIEYTKDSSGPPFVTVKAVMAKAITDGVEFKKTTIYQRNSGATGDDYSIDADGAAIVLDVTDY